MRPSVLWNIQARARGRSPEGELPCILHKTLGWKDVEITCEKSIKAVNVLSRRYFFGLVSSFKEGYLQSKKWAVWFLFHSKLCKTDHCTSQLLVLYSLLWFLLAKLLDLSRFLSISNTRISLALSKFHRGNTGAVLTFHWVKIIWHRIRISLAIHTFQVEVILTFHWVKNHMT